MNKIQTITERLSDSLNIQMYSQMSYLELFLRFTISRPKWMIDDIYDKRQSVVRIVPNLQLILKNLLDESY